MHTLDNNQNSLSSLNLEHISGVEEISDFKAEKLQGGAFTVTCIAEDGDVVGVSATDGLRVTFSADSVSELEIVNDNANARSEYVGTFSAEDVDTRRFSFSGDGTYLVPDDFLDVVGGFTVTIDEIPTEPPTPRSRIISRVAALLR